MMAAIEHALRTEGLAPPDPLAGPLAPRGRPDGATARFVAAPPPLRQETAIMHPPPPGRLRTLGRRRRSRPPRSRHDRAWLIVVAIVLVAAFLVINVGSAVLARRSDVAPSVGPPERQPLARSRQRRCRRGSCSARRRPSTAGSSSGVEPGR
jgi:hypothetical protein